MNNKMVYFLIFSGAAVIASGQNNKQAYKTEVLTYVSATYDPASNEKQIEFHSSSNEKRIFYYSGKELTNPEEQFFNQPSEPITTEGLNLTKVELKGKKYKIIYRALTESATTECCFTIKSCELVK